MSDQQAGMASQAHQPFADKLARAKAKGVTLATRIHLPEAAAASFRLDGVERALRRLDIPVRVLTSQPPADGPKPEDPQGVSVSRWPVLRDKSGYPCRVLRLDDVARFGGIGWQFYLCLAQR